MLKFLFAVVPLLAVSTTPTLQAQQTATYLITGIPDWETVCANGAPPQGLAGPFGLAVDSSGNLYIAAWKLRRICKVSPDGRTNVLASDVGNGSFLYDSVPLAVDGNGNVYFAEIYPPQLLSGMPAPPPNRVRRVSPNGAVTTVLEASVTGLAVDSTGVLYFSTGNRISKISASGTVTNIAGNGTTGSSGDGGRATSAALNGATAMTFDSSGSLVFFDSGSSKIRKVSPTGMINSVTTQTSVKSMASDVAGSLYLAGDATIRRVSPQGAVTVIAGSGDGSGNGGAATDVRLSITASLAMDPSGQIFFAEWSYAVRKLIATQSSIGCLYNLDKTSIYINPEGGLGGFQVIASAPTCAWLAYGTETWVKIDNNGVSTGNGIVSFVVSPNTSAAGRSAALWAAGKTFAVNQGGVACELTVMPTIASVGPDGGTGVVSIQSSLPDCTWSASTSEKWLFLTGSVSGIGNGKLTYAAAANDAAIRTAKIAIKGVQGSRTYSVDFQLRQAAKGGVLPIFTAGAVVNAASGIGGAISPGGFVAVYGSGLGPVQGVKSDVAVKVLAGSRVFAHGTEAFLTYSSATQINFLVPNSTIGNPTTDIQVEYQLLQSGSTPVLVIPAQPGIFTVDGSGSGPAVAVNADGTFNSEANPAARGSEIAFWLTGQGRTVPESGDGQQPQAPDFPQPALPISIKVAGRTLSPEDIRFVGLVYPGITQVNVRVNDGVPPGKAEVVVGIGGVESRPGVTLSIQ
jgi:uncharacterized protein (TIGR03437 family)